MPAECSMHEWQGVTLASIGDAVITTDIKGAVTFLNPVAESLTGWTQLDAAGMALDSIFKIVNEDSRCVVENPAFMALRDGVTVELATHTLLIAKNGTERPIDDSAALIRNAKGDVSGCVLIFRDISDRRRSELKLEVSEVRYRRLFESAKDGILILDLGTSTIADANPYMSELLDYAHADLIGKELWQIGLFKDIEANKAAFRELKEKQYIRYEDLPLQTSTGRMIDVEFVSNVYSEGKHSVIQCNIRDITQRKRLENEAKKHVRDLSEADARKNEFLAMLAHELRNPLAPIRNSLQIIRIKNGDIRAVELASAMIERQVGQMVLLVDDLLDVSRITRGKIELRRAIIELASTIRNAADAVSSLYKVMNHELTVTLPSQPIYLDADPTRLSQVVGNLLNNACKYTDRGGRISLVVEKLGEQALIRVQDNGIGIAAESLPHVFEIFYQVDTSLERSVSGLGIGLTLVKNLVAMHDGTVEAKSAGKGLGSEFIVSLPIIVETSLPLPPELTNHEPPIILARRILVVDDNWDSATSLSLLLELTGYETRTAFDGLEAVESAATFRPEVLLLDLVKPVNLSALMTLLAELKPPLNCP